MPAIQHDGIRSRMLDLLRGAQEAEGYVSKQAMARIAADLGASPSEVYGVASFFDHFRLTPPGRHSVRVCTGTACHVKGSKLVLSEWERELGIRAGQTTKDGEFDLDEVACIGCCNLACAVVVDGEVEGEFKSADVKGSIRRVRIADEARVHGEAHAGSCGVCHGE